MKKKTLYNIKGAGRPAIHERGIRHTSRDEIKRLTVLHLTVKIDKAKAKLKNKETLKLLHKAILKARKQGLGVVHYTLEYDHIHLMVETANNKILGKGMQAFGITLSKGINKIKALKGRVFKTRYHYRKLKTPKEIKNALNYILGNAVKHRSSTFVNLYNSLGAIKNFTPLYEGFELSLENLFSTSRTLFLLRTELDDLLNSPTSFHLKNLTT